MEKHELIEAWRSTICGDDKSWVLFEHGTCVVLMQPERDLAAQAIRLLQEFGPVRSGTSHGDFGTTTLDNGLGYVVTCHHNDILTFVGWDEAGREAGDLVVGLKGRAKRGKDAEQLQIIHIEDRRH